MEPTDEQDEQFVEPGASCWYGQRDCDPWYVNPYYWERTRFGYGRTHYGSSGTNGESLSIEVSLYIDD